MTGYATRPNPTDDIDVGFDAYVSGRRALTDAHLEGGIPDYAYGADYSLRQKMKAIPGMLPLFKALTNQYVPQQRQRMNMTGLKVGPAQFPDVYQMGVDCARRLGIGIPAIYIEENPAAINAYAYATDDDAPLIVVTSAMLERTTPGELKAVIGHECGHIHNNHAIYNVAASLILEAAAGIPGLQQIVGLVSMPMRLALQAWSRAAEVTCDRAGVICSDDAEDTVSAQMKFAFGAAMGRGDVNVEALLKQFEAFRDTPLRLLELDRTHPVGARRILAVREFLNSETLFGWRPEWKTAGGQPLNKQELDARCERYISVVKGKEGRV